MRSPDAHGERRWMVIVQHKELATAIEYYETEADAMEAAQHVRMGFVVVAKVIARTGVERWA